MLSDLSDPAVRTDGLSPRHPRRTSLGPPNGQALVDDPFGVRCPVVRVVELQQRGETHQGLEKRVPFHGHGDRLSGPSNRGEPRRTTPARSN